MAKHKEIFNRGYYANGVYMNVLEEIVKAQAEEPDLICYLQPYMDSVVTQLRDFTADKGYIWKLYASTSSDLNHIHYVADIVGWEDKRSLSASRLMELNSHIQKFQKGEVEIYDKGVNLIAIKNLKRVVEPIPITSCIKIENGTPVKERTQAGRFSYIYPFVIDSTTNTLFSNQLLEKELEVNVSDRKKLTQEKLLERLYNAQKLPEKIQIVSIGFKRNPSVVAYVLKRASGICELCKSPAPFKKQDGTPYLEVHHWTPLADGGEDTIQNAAALCPNCHKQAHFGVNAPEIKLLKDQFNNKV